jgi:hypothetical protein
MREVKTLMAALTAGSLILGVQAAMAAPQAAKAPEGPQASATQAMPKPEIRRVRGEVTAVEPSANPPTLTMKTMAGKEELTVGVDVTGKTIIREGKVRKNLADIKAGDRVWMRYERTDGKLVADYIRILKPTRMAAKGERYEKREEYQKSEAAGKAPAPAAKSASPQKSY